MKKDWREKVGEFLSNEFVEIEVKPYEEGKKNAAFTVNRNIENEIEFTKGEKYEYSETKEDLTEEEKHDYFEAEEKVEPVSEEQYGYSGAEKKSESVSEEKYRHFDKESDSTFATANSDAVIDPEKIPLTHRMVAKVIAFILVLVMGFTFAGSVTGAVLMYDYGIYSSSKEAFRYDLVHNVTNADAYNMVQNLAAKDEISPKILCDENNIAEVKITKQYQGINDDKVYPVWEYSKDTRTPESKAHVNTVYWTEDHQENGKMTEVLYSVEIKLAETLHIQDKYYLAEKLANMIYSLRFMVYPIGVVSFVLAIAAFIFLMCSSGRRAGSRDPQPGWGTAIPFDLTTAALCAASVGLLYIVEEIFFYNAFWVQVLGICCACGLIAIMVLGWFMSFAVRLKLGKWWKNTVIFFALVLFWRVLKVCGRGFIRVCRALGRFIGMIPMVWRTILILAAVILIEAFVIACCWWLDVFFVWWVVSKCIQVPLVIWLAVTLRKLQKGGDALADGDLGYHIDTKRMVWDFKKHGENLNSIGAGMNRAVEQRLKSERMKTELITNVSHDIKTPLTSIINYSDLICKEETDNENIKEYADVLHRQSERLKRLIEDLVEASKASTGNLEVNLSPCEVGVMLTQTVGEYQEKLKKANLDLITSQPEEPTVIMADGRRLWRVIDNLMNNLCKYSMPGTRVYLTLEAKKGEAVISFKNISKAPLNISADELMERFVRGDASRNTEGNGLGLSIAKSLTELQKGKMEITTDGDLFKVVLKFPIIR